MFASHLWVRAAAVMSGGAEEPSPVKAFLSPLNLLEYRDLLKEPGADVPGVDSPGSGLTRPPAGPGPARMSPRAEGDCIALYDVWRVWLYRLYRLYTLYTLYSVTGEP